MWLLLDAYCSSQGVATASRQEQPRRTVLTPLLVLGETDRTPPAFTAGSWLSESRGSGRSPAGKS
jgi:hypothetical protein